VLKTCTDGWNEWPNISVIIVNLNGKKWLEKCFKSVLASDYPADKFEIIFVDNGSTDGSIEFAKGLILGDPRIKLIHNKKNMGWSPANNQGMKLAKGEIIVCLSNDMEVDPSWLKEITLTMKNDSSIGVVQCNSLSMWDRQISDSAMNYLDKFGYAYGYTPAIEPTEVFFAEGMAFAFTRKVMDEIGMLDDYYFMEYDDIDFSWRARLAGYKVFFVPAAKVYHARGGTVGATYFQRSPNVSWYVRNHMVTLLKNYEFKNILKVLPIVTAINVAKATYFFVSGNRKIAYSTFKGSMRVLLDIRVIMSKRKAVQSIRQVSDSEIMKAMHFFNLKLLFSFITSQARGKRFISNLKPPIKSDRIKINRDESMMPSVNEELREETLNIDEIQKFYDRVFSKGVPFKVPGNFYSWVLDLLQVKNGNILDVGCGGGYLLSLVERKGLTTYGIDISKKAVEIARKNAPKSKIFVGDAEHILWKDCAFDYVTCLGSLEHLPDISQGVKEISRVLKESGRACIVVPNTFSLVNIWKVYREGEIERGQIIECFKTRREWEMIIEDNGLKIVEIHKYNYLFFPISSLGQLIYRLVAPFIPLNLTYHFAFVLTKQR